MANPQHDATASSLLHEESHIEQSGVTTGQEKIFSEGKALHLLICKGIPAIRKQVARHDGAAIADAALVQLRELQGRRGQWLEGTLYLGTRQEGLHTASRPQQKPHMDLIFCIPGFILASCAALPDSGAGDPQQGKHTWQGVGCHAALTPSMTANHDGLT